MNWRQFADFCKRPEFWQMGQQQRKHKNHFSVFKQWTWYCSSKLAFKMWFRRLTGIKRKHNKLGFAFLWRHYFEYESKEVCITGHLLHNRKQRRKKRRGGSEFTWINTCPWQNWEENWGTVIPSQPAHCPQHIIKKIKAKINFKQVEFIFF